MQKKAIVIGGSRGMGKAIADELAKAGLVVTGTSKAELDTADLSAMEKFAKSLTPVDVVVLNTGGPPQRAFQEIANLEWETYHRQMFLGFAVFLKHAPLADNAYLFAITSGGIKEPQADLLLSGTYRAALTSLLKVLSKLWAERGISIVNIAPGPIETDRLRELVADMDEFKNKLPMKRLGRPEEIGKFVRVIVENEIKYLNGVTVNFDGGRSNFLF